MNEGILKFQERNQWLLADDAELQLQCRRDTMRGTGPGGQKRNKTESMVRLTHLPSGVVALDDTSRSQHQNRAAAIAKLRINIAIFCRLPFCFQTFRHPISRQAYPLWLAVALDALAESEYQAAPAAKAMGMSTAQFLKEIGKTPLAWQAVIRERQLRGLPVLHAR